MKIQIEKMGINGEGIGYYRNKPVFIAGCFPSETVEWQIKEDRKSYYIGSLVRIDKQSRQRRRSFCPYSRKCGSCPMIELDYQAQLENKRELLKEALYKYALLDINPEMTVASPLQQAYRNKCYLPVVEADGRLVNAMYQSGSNHPVIIDQCPLHEQQLEEVRKGILSALNQKKLKAYDHKLKKGVRQLMVRGFEGKYQAVIITGEDALSSHLIEEIMKDERIVSLYQIVNTIRNPLNLMEGKARLLDGLMSIELSLEGKRFSLTPQSFFQLNTAQALNIYNKVRELIGDDNRTVVEAFCGTGIMTAMLAQKCEKIIGIDIEKSSISDARENAKNNGISNAQFICADANTEIGKIARKQEIDVMVVDPPRSGLGEEFIETIKRSRPGKIIYVSCNPATLAKNLESLKKHYSLELIQPYDMFPQTQHVECVALLVRK
ncbi:MAG: 23S rRNA (uracil(1939)-C(5))-methyltransferase RlmD [Erysipelotrichaceae bacterium]|nr:23S rRNA (uracil(1939)-C(5))-methyltransferase RlmD [Erysipelotrichaceae bacterium]